MADKRVYDVPELITPDDNDYINIIDVSDTTDSPQGSYKKIKKVNLGGGVTINDTTPSLTKTYSSEKSEDTFVKRSGTEVGKPIDGDLEFSFGSGLTTPEADGLKSRIFSKDGKWYVEIIDGLDNPDFQFNPNKGLFASKLFDIENDENAYLQKGHIVQLEEDVFDLRLNKADLVGGLVPSSQLPAYVDDIVEGYILSGVFYKEDTHTTVIAGEVGKIYVDLTTGQKSRQYRWSGTVYIQITNGLIASTDDVPEGSNLYFTTAKVLSTLLTGISFITGGAIVSTDSVLIAFGKIQKQINDFGTALGLKQDSLTDDNFGTFTNSVATKNTQADTDVLAYVDVTTGKWVKQTFSKLVDYLKGYFQTSRIIVTSNITAVNGSVYHNNGNNTFTDPTGAAGMGYYVYVAFGTATIGSTTYAKGSYIFRAYDGTSWNTEIIKNGIGQKIITGNVTLNDTYHNCIVLVKNTATITVPYGLTISFNCVFDCWAGATATFVQGTNVDVIETALTLSPLKMASLYQDSSTKGLTTEVYKLKGETS